MNFKKLNIYNKPLTVFQKNVFSMLKGTVIAQFIGIIGGLYLAKIYGSENYGFLGVFFSVVAILSIVNTLQLEYSIVLTKKINTRKQIVSLLLITSIIITLLIIIIIYILAPFLIVFISKKSLFLGVLGAYLLTQIKIFEYFLISINDFKIISISKILISFFTIAFQLLLFYFFPKNGLIYGYLIAVFLVAIYFLKINFHQIISVSIENVKKIIAENNTLIKFAFPSNLINAVANNIMPILIMAYFSISESASFFLSVKLLSAPLMLISNSISKPYFQKATEYYTNKQSLLSSFTKKITINNVLIMITSIIFLNILIYFFLNSFLGDKWTHLINFSIILSFLFFTKSVFSPISSIVEITNNNHIGLYFNSYLFLINLIAIAIGVYYNSSITCVLIMSFFSGLGYLFMYFYFLKIIKN